MKYSIKSVIGLFLVFSSILSRAQNDYYLFIGTYTSGKSEGIYVYKFDTVSAKNSLVSKVKTSNPSYLAVSTLTNMLFAVNENKRSNENPEGGTISSFSFDKKTGVLTFLDKKSSGGDDPCYISVDNSGKWLFTGNYTSGTIAISPILKGGKLGVPSQSSQHYGSSVNKDRQESPHVHGTFLSPNEKYLLVPDLGFDKVMVYPLNIGKEEVLTLALDPFILTPGAGPRHLDFHPQKSVVYVLEELTGYVTVCIFKNGILNLIQRINAHPDDFVGKKGSADIHVSPDGKFLYASNRGEMNNIAIFKIDEISGKLTSIGHQSVMGKTPRNFSFDPSGNFLLVANQNSDEIVIFKVDKKTGLLSDAGLRIGVPNPVCLKWLSSK